MCVVWWKVDALFFSMFAQSCWMKYLSSRKVNDVEHCRGILGCSGRNLANPMRSMVLHADKTNKGWVCWRWTRKWSWRVLRRQHRSPVVKEVREGRWDGWPEDEWTSCRCWCCELRSEGGGCFGGVAHCGVLSVQHAVVFQECSGKGITSLCLRSSFKFVVLVWWQFFAVAGQSARISARHIGIYSSTMKLPNTEQLPYFFINFSSLAFTRICHNAGQ